MDLIEPKHIKMFNLDGSVEIINLKTLNSHFRSLISDYTAKALCLLSLAHKCLENTLWKLNKILFRFKALSLYLNQMPNFSYLVKTSHSRGLDFSLFYFPFYSRNKKLNF